jgi:hypothetical protein
VVVEVVRGCASLALARWRWQRALKKKETTPTQMSTNTATKAITPPFDDDASARVRIGSE